MVQFRPRPCHELPHRLGRFGYHGTADSDPQQMPTYHQEQRRQTSHQPHDPDSNDSHRLLGAPLSDVWVCTARGRDAQMRPVAYGREETCRVIHGGGRARADCWVWMQMSRAVEPGRSPRGLQPKPGTSSHVHVPADRHSRPPGPPEAPVAPAAEPPQPRTPAGIRGHPIRCTPLLVDRSTPPSQAPNCRCSAPRRPRYW